MVNQQSTFLRNLRLYTISFRLWSTLVRPLFLVKRIEILISGDSASFEGSKHAGSSIDSLISCLELIKTNIRRARSLDLPLAVHPSENISNEQTIRFEPVLHHPDTPSSQASILASRGGIAASSITNLNFATIYLLRSPVILLRVFPFAFPSFSSTIMVYHSHLLNCAANIARSCRELTGNKVDIKYDFLLYYLYCDNKKE